MSTEVETNSMSEDVAISVRGLSKCYRLGAINRKTLSDEISYWWHRLRGQDPRMVFAKVGDAGTETRKIKEEERDNQEFWALNDVSFDVRPGEVIGVIGRNGAGKSTLLKILTRITEPTSGEAIINGRVASLLEVGTGFHPELTGRENVYMNGTILGMKRREITAKFDEIVAFAELSKFIDTPVKRYSSGMYVRLAFAVAAHLDPEILLIDEVLAVGDAGFQRKCLGKMSEIAGQGRTVLFVSHNMASVRQLTERCVVLDGGKIVFDGPSDEAVDYYRSRFMMESAIGHVHISDAMHEQSKKMRRQIEFREIIMADESGTAKGNFSVFEPIRIAMLVEAKLESPAIEYVMQIKTTDDVVVSTISTGRIDHRITPGKYWISCLLQKPPLAKGHYKLLVYVLSGNRIAEDCIPNAVIFDVDHGAFYRPNERELSVNHGDVLVVQRVWSDIEKA
jgi:lipopolysaccharide transport system ATP-binding protein